MHEYAIFSLIRGGGVRRLRPMLDPPLNRLITLSLLSHSHEITCMVQDICKSTYMLRKKETSHSLMLLAHVSVLSSTDKEEYLCKLPALPALEMEYHVCISPLTQTIP